MCTNGRFITNKYTRQRYFVSCGHCPACLQEKASKRMRRIYSEYTDDHQVLFVTLTYNRDSCPYIKFSDVYQKLDKLPIYRDVRLQRTFGDSKIVKEPQVLGYINLPNYFSGFEGLTPLAHRHHNIGVCWFKDIQDFHKRLNIELKRKYNYNGYFKCFNATEYGEDTQRPHAHLLLWFEYGWKEEVRRAILASWPFADKGRMERGIEEPADATAYVSSYVNSPSDFPAFLKDNFCPKHSFSKFLGHNLHSFLLSSLLEKIRRRDLTYLCRIVRQNVPTDINIPVPSYVINRYFPKFKGFTRIDSTKVLDVLRNPARLRDFRLEVDYSEDDIGSIQKQLCNRYFTYFFPLGISYDDYCILYNSVWTIYRSNCYRMFMEDDTVSWFEKYDNVFEVDNCAVQTDIPYPVGSIINPNEFPSRISRSNYWTQKFYEKVKRKKVSDTIQQF